MADVAYRSPAATYPRWTRGNIRRFAAKAVGLGSSQITGDESDVLNQTINAEIALARDRLPIAFKGFGERVATITFDPASVDTRLELPADFSSLKPAGKIYRLDSSGDVVDQVQVINAEAYPESFSQGDSPYTDRVEAIAYLYGVSTNNRRFIEIKPAPSESTDYRLEYIAELEDLDDDADVLEAPLSVHYPIAWKVGAVLLTLRGAGSKADKFEAKGEANLAILSSAGPSERHRPARLIPFDHRSKRGYESADYAR